MERGFKNIMLFGMVLMLVALIAPQFAMAAGNDIFETIEGKLYSTLNDVRTVVYVIAGFGLIMFAVLAIFNKISFKHLGYIMIGLSLLALLFPFLEYFSGDSAKLKEQAKLDFDHYINADVNSSLQGTGDDEIQNQNYDGEKPDAEGADGSETTGDITEDDLNKGANAQEGEENYDDIDDTIDPDLQAELDAEQAEIDKLYKENQKKEAYKNAGCDESGKGSWNKETLTRTICSYDEKTGQVAVSKEACEGGRISNNGKCKGNAVTVARNIAKGAQAAAGAINSIIATGAGVINTGLSVGAGIANVGEAVKNANYGGDNFLDALKNAGNSTANIIGAISSSAQNTASNASSTLMNAKNSIANASVGASVVSTDYENNPTGSNAFTDAWNAKDENGNYTSGVRNALEGTVGDINKTGNAVGVIGGYGASAAHNASQTADAVQNVGARIEDAKNKAQKTDNRIKNLFNRNGKKK